MLISFPLFNHTSCMKATVSTCKHGKKLNFFLHIVSFSQGWASAFTNSGKQKKSHPSLHRQHQAGQLWGAALWELGPRVQLGAVVHVHQPPQGLVGRWGPLTAHQVCCTARQVRCNRAECGKTKWEASLERLDAQRGCCVVTSPVEGCYWVNSFGRGYYLAMVCRSTGSCGHCVGLYSLVFNCTWRRCFISITAFSFWKS